MGWVGVIDESTPSYRDGLVVYGLALVIVDSSDVAHVRGRLEAVLDRKRPLHWESEGVNTRAKVAREICALPVTAHVASLIVDPKQQQHARTRLLSERLLPAAGEAGAEEFLIERRSEQEDNRDRQEIRSWFRASSYRFSSIEHVPKSEPLAWLSDALSGMWTDIVLERCDPFVWDLFGTGTLRSIWQHRIEP